MIAALVVIAALCAVVSVALLAWSSYESVKKDRRIRAYLDEDEAVVVIRVES